MGCHASRYRASTTKKEHSSKVNVYLDSSKANTIGLGLVLGENGINRAAGVTCKDVDVDCLRWASENLSSGCLFWPVGTARSQGYNLPAHAVDETWVPFGPDGARSVLDEGKDAVRKALEDIRIEVGAESWVKAAASGSPIQLINAVRKMNAPLNELKEKYHTTFRKGSINAHIAYCLINSQYPSISNNTPNTENTQVLYDRHARLMINGGWLDNAILGTGVLLFETDTTDLDRPMPDQEHLVGTLTLYVWAEASSMLTFPATQQPPNSLPSAARLTRTSTTGAPTSSNDSAPILTLVPYIKLHKVPYIFMLQKIISMDNEETGHSYTLASIQSRKALDNSDIETEVRSKSNCTQWNKVQQLRLKSLDETTSVINDLTGTDEPRVHCWAKNLTTPTNIISGYTAKNTRFSHKMSLASNNSLCASVPQMLTLDAIFNSRTEQMRVAAIPQGFGKASAICASAEPEQGGDFELHGLGHIGKLGSTGPTEGTRIVVSMWNEYVAVRTPRTEPPGQWIKDRNYFVTRDERVFELWRRMNWEQHMWNADVCSTLRKVPQTSA